MKISFFFFFNLFLALFKLETKPKEKSFNKDKRRASLESKPHDSRIDDDNYH